MSELGVADQLYYTIDGPAVILTGTGISPNIYNICGLHGAAVGSLMDRPSQTSMQTADKIFIPII